MSLRRHSLINRDCTTKTSCQLYILDNRIYYVFCIGRMVVFRHSILLIYCVEESIISNKPIYIKDSILRCWWMLKMRWFVVSSIKSQIIFFTYSFNIRSSSRIVCFCFNLRLIPNKLLFQLILKFTQSKLTIYYMLYHNLPLISVTHYEQIHFYSR